MILFFLNCEQCGIFILKGLDTKTIETVVSKSKSKTQKYRSSSWTWSKFVFKTLWFGKRIITEQSWFYRPVKKSKYLIWPGGSYFERIGSLDTKTIDRDGGTIFS